MKLLPLPPSNVPLVLFGKFFFSSHFLFSNLLHKRPSGQRTQGAWQWRRQAPIIASGRTHFARWSDKNQHDGPKHFLLFLGLSFYPLILRLMKNCTRCSSELSRFRGNNYQCGDLCFSRLHDKHPAPWGMVWKWYNFKRVKFHCFLHPRPPSPIRSSPTPPFPLSFLFRKKCERNFFVDRGKKKKREQGRLRETIKNIKRPIFTEH